MPAGRGRPRTRELVSIRMEARSRRAQPPSPLAGNATRGQESTRTADDIQPAQQSGTGLTSDLRILPASPVAQYGPRETDVSDHPSREELMALTRGRLPASRAKEVLRHLMLESCASCQAAAPSLLAVLLGMK